MNRQKYEMHSSPSNAWNSLGPLDCYLTLANIITKFLGRTEALKEPTPRDQAAFLTYRVLPVSLAEAGELRATVSEADVKCAGSMVKGRAHDRGM